MNWIDGHPQNWREAMVKLGGSLPPEQHNWEGYGCTWCGRRTDGNNYKTLAEEAMEP